MMIGAFDLLRVRSLTEQFLSWGARCLKVKVGLDLPGDIVRVQLVRELAGPGVPITIDANCGWNVATARVALDRLRRFDLLVAEQPIGPGDTDAMSFLRSMIGIPIMADESVFSLADAWIVLRAHAADVISVYPGKNGGIASAFEIAHVARSAGIPCHVGSNLELGVGSAAMLHLACAVPNIDSEIYPADILGPHYHESDLLTEPLTLDFEGAECRTVPDSASRSTRTSCGATGMIELRDCERHDGRPMKCNPQSRCLRFIDNRTLISSSRFLGVSAVHKRLPLFREACFQGFGAGLKFSWQFADSRN